MAKDPWERSWKLHLDGKGIMAGIKDREFTLKLAATIGEVKIYDIDYTPELATEDPFARTQFIQFGDVLPPAPGTPLEEWRWDLESDYEQLIHSTLNGAGSEIIRLQGEKIVRKGNANIRELVTLLLIPGFNKKNEMNRVTVVDLLYVICATKSPKAPEDDAGPSALLPFIQDGTAHGNPK
jgi:hypothetical protein